MIFCIKIIAYFLVYSFIGWFIESAFKSYLQKELVNSGFLIGPICPIYGFGAFILHLTIYNFRDNLILVFFLGFFMLSIWEYIVGWFLEKMFNTKYWDYTGNFMNIKGRVCLFNSTAWGVLSVLFVGFWHPFIEEKINLIPENILIIAVSILSIITLSDIIISVIKTKVLNKNLDEVKKLDVTIEEKQTEINNTKENITGYRKSMQDVIDTLKNKRDMLKEKIIKQTDRLRKAFPTMKSEKITEFFNQKLDEIRELKDKLK